MHIRQWQIPWERKLKGTMRAEERASKLDQNSKGLFSEEVEVIIELYNVLNL